MTATTPEVLSRLDGWKTDTEDATRYDVKGQKIIDTITNAEIKASAYLGNYTFTTPTIATYFDNAVADWTAGLLYNSRETIDTQYVTTDNDYGAILIQQAKDTLDVMKGETSGSSSETIQRETEILGFAYKYDKDILDSRIDTTLIYPEPNSDDDDDD